MTWVIFAILCLAAIAAAAPICKNIDADSVRREVQPILVGGIGTAKQGKAAPAYFPEIGTIDRLLTMRFRNPALTQSGAASLCSRTWTCAEQDFTVCPGMQVTTAQVRRELWRNRTWHKPTFSFDATVGKKYTMLFFDALQPIFPSIAPGSTAYFHYAAFNVDDAEGLNAPSLLGSQEFQAWAAPANPFSTSPNHHIFALFEHDTTLSFNYAEVNDIVLAGNFEVEKFMKAAKLDTAKLVAVNWMKVYGSIGSREIYGAERADSFGATCKTFLDCRACTGELDMCTPDWERSDCGCGVHVEAARKTTCAAKGPPVFCRDTRLVQPWEVVIVVVVMLIGCYVYACFCAPNKRKITLPAARIPLERAPREAVEIPELSDVVLERAPPEAVEIPELSGAVERY